MSKLVPVRLERGAPLYCIDTVRRIYNATIADLATKPLKPNTWDHQYIWWRNIDFDKTVIHAYCPEPWPGVIVAFSKVTYRGDHCTPLFAIDPEWHGRGFGEEIIQHYLSVARPKPLRGSQLVSNGAICHLNEKAGWQIESTVDGVQHLYHPNGRDKFLPLEHTCKVMLDYHNGD